jgi:kynurenine formamidase
MSKTSIRTLVLVVAAALAAAAGTAAITLAASPGTATGGAAAAAGAKTITYSKVVELSQPISQKIPLWPGDPKVVFKVVATMKKDGYYLRSFTIGEHSATHMNSANSFISGDKTAITDYPATQRVVPAAVIDVRAKCAANADYQLTKQDVLDWEAAHGQLQPGTFVIMLTGWEDKWGSPKAFINQDAKGNLHFPGFAGATSAWLLSDRQIAGVGIDTHGVDPGLDTSYATNAAIATAHKLALECMGHLDELPATGATLVLAPLQLKGGSGSPLSVVALVP